MDRMTVHLILRLLPASAIIKSTNSRNSDKLVILNLLKMRFPKIFLSLFILGVILSMGISSAFGHGLGSEIMLPVVLGSKFITLEVSSNQIPDTETREISFNLFYPLLTSEKDNNGN